MISSPGAGHFIHDVTNEPGIVRGFSRRLIAGTTDRDLRQPDVQEIHGAAHAAMDLLAQLKASPPPEQP